MKKLQLMILLSLFGLSAHAETVRLGDMNNDNKITITDVTQLLNLLKSNTTSFDLRRQDINQDGKVDLQDVTMLVEVVLGKKALPAVSEEVGIGGEGDPD